MSPSSTIVAYHQSVDEISHCCSKIEAAVAFINHRADAPAKSMLVIGKYLLREFFNDDVEVLCKRAPKKDVSLRKLAEHPEITVSHVTLSNSVRLAVQDNLFTDSNYEFLSPTHKLLLLGLPDDATRIKYADIAVEKQLSVRRLKDLLILKKLILPRGRKPLIVKRESRSTDPEQAFFKPLDKLARVAMNLEDLDPSIVTERRVVMLTALRERINEILEIVNGE